MLIGLHTKPAMGRNNMAQSALDPNSPEAWMAQHGASTDSGSSDIYTKAVQQYPIIKNANVTPIVTHDPNNKNMMEFWPQGEQGGPNQKRPDQLPLNQRGIQIFSDKAKPSDVAADVVSHYLVHADPALKGDYQGFVQTFNTPEEQQRLKSDYAWAQKHEGEKRPFEQWATQTRIPAYFRGYVFDQWPDSAKAKMFTPDQQKILDKMSKTITSPANANAASDPNSPEAWMAAQNSEIPVQGVDYAGEPSKPAPDVGAEINAITSGQDTGTPVGMPSVVDAAKSVVTGATTGALGAIGGTLGATAGAIAEGDFGTPEAANKIENAAAKGANKLTYHPTTEQGRQILEHLSNLAEPLVAVAPATAEMGAIAEGGRAVAPVAGELAGKAAAPVKSIFDYQSPTKQAIAHKISTGQMDVETAPYRLKGEIPDKHLPAETGGKVAQYIADGAPKIEKDPNAIEAIKQGFDKGVVATIKGADPTDKSKMLQMVDIKERAKQNAHSAALNRPSDVVGNSLLERYKTVHQANRQAGNELDSIAKSLKGQQVDIHPAVHQFLNDLQDLGVRFNKNMVPIFRNSDVEGVKSAENVIRSIVKRMRETKVPDAYDVHRLKRFIDERSKYGTQGEGLKGAAERVVKRLRHNLDGELDSQFPEYDRVNTVYAKTRNAMDDLQSVAGKKMDLSGPNADKALGVLMRRIMSNAQSRTNLLDSMNQIQQVANEVGGNYKGDLVTQAMFADELDAVFGTDARTSFQGQIKQGLSSEDVATAADVARGSPTGLLRAAHRTWKRTRGIDQKKGFKAIRDLLRDNQRKNNQ